MSSSAQCSVSGNIVTISNPFGLTGYYTSGGAALSFIFNTGGTNPTSVKDAGQFIITTSQIVGTDSYPISTSTFDSGTYTPTPSALSAVVSLVSSYTAYASPTTYSLAITPTHSLPVSSYLTITFPPQITLAGIKVPSCTYTINGAS